MKWAVVTVLMIFLVGLMGGCNRVDLDVIGQEVDADWKLRKTRETQARGERGEIDSVTLLVEFVEVPKSLMNEFASTNPLQKDADNLRRQAQIWMKANQARLFDMAMVQSRSGEQAKVKSVSEVIYPGTYVLPLDSPPPQKAKVDSDKEETEKAKPAPPPPARVPVDFEVRDTGSIVTFSPTNIDPQTIEIEINPELTFRLNETVWETKADGSTAQIETPMFHLVNVASTVTVKNGGYAFLGGHALPKEKQSQQFEEAETMLLIFVRADSF